MTGGISTTLDPFHQRCTIHCCLSAGHLAPTDGTEEVLTYSDLNRTKTVTNHNYLQSNGRYQ